MTAPYATTVFDGRNVTSKPPKTEIWCMLYAQVVQADARSHRNILLTEAKLEVVKAKDLDLRTFHARRFELDARASNSLTVNVDAPTNGVFTWTEKEIRQLLDLYSLAPDAPLSVLAVEMMPRYDRYIVHGDGVPDDSVRPLSRDLSQYRILRTSPLVATPEICCENC